MIFVLTKPAAVTDKVGRFVQLPGKPVTFVAMDLPADRVRAALGERPTLLWADGRHQLWLRGRFGEQVVLDELGVLYCYPDDPAFRDGTSHGGSWTRVDSRRRNVP